MSRSVPKIGVCKVGGATSRLVWVHPPMSDTAERRLAPTGGEIKALTAVYARRQDEITWKNSSKTINTPLRHR